MSKTTSGFKFEIDERIKKDWDFLEAVADLQENPSNFSNIKKLFTMLIGEKGFDDLKEHIKSQNDGFCPVDTLTKELIEIIQSDNNIKK